MVRKTKYKSVGVNDDTYEMIVELAKREKRNISQQLAMIVEQKFHETFKEEISRNLHVSRNIHGGISGALSD
jgi:hypothetical protein